MDRYGSFLHVLVHYFADTKVLVCLFISVPIKKSCRGHGLFDWYQATPKHIGTGSVNLWCEPCIWAFACYLFLMWYISHREYLALSFPQSEILKKRPILISYCNCSHLWDTNLSEFVPLMTFSWIDFNTKSFQYYVWLQDFANVMTKHFALNLF